MDQKTRILTLLYEYSEDVFYKDRDNFAMELGLDNLSVEYLLNAAERKISLGLADIRVRADDYTFNSILNY